MVSETVLFYAKYPFTKYAKDYIDSKKVEIKDEHIEKAKERIVNGIKNNLIPKFAEFMDNVLEEEIIAYAVSRMIVSGLDSRYFAAKYAVAEAKRSMSYITNENETNVIKLL